MGVHNLASVQFVIDLGRLTPGVHVLQQTSVKKNTKKKRNRCKSFLKTNRWIRDFKLVTAINLRKKTPTFMNLNYISNFNLG